MKYKLGLFILMASLFATQSFASGIYIVAGGGMVKQSLGSFKFATLRAPMGTWLNSGAERKFKLDGFFGIGMNLVQIPLSLELNYTQFSNNTYYFSFNPFPIETQQLNISAQALYLNAIYHLALANDVVPYFGAGIGGARMQLSGKQLAPDVVPLIFPPKAFNKRVAYDVVAGIDKQLNDNWFVGLMYRFADMNEFKLNSSNKLESYSGSLNGNSIDVTVKYLMP